jgi:hypothetical protein
MNVGGPGKLNFTHPSLPSEKWVHGNSWSGSWVEPTDNQDVEAKGKYLLLPRFEPRLSGPYSSHYSDWAILIPYVYIRSLFDCTLRSHTVSNDCIMMNKWFERKRSWCSLRWKSWSLSGGTEENNQNPLPVPRQRLEPDTPLIQFMTLLLRSQHSLSSWYSGIRKGMRNFVKWAMSTCKPVHLHASSEAWNYLSMIRISSRNSSLHFRLDVFVCESTAEMDSSRVHSKYLVMAVRFSFPDCDRPRSHSTVAGLRTVQLRTCRMLLSARQVVSASVT